MKTAAIILFVILPFNCLAQNKGDLKKIENMFAEKSHNHNWGDQLKDNRNELNFILSATFVLYKEILSSQDIDACVFTPSCSVYAIESVKQEGIIIGFMNSIDRLTRCNPGPKRDVPIDLSTGKYFDPVESIPKGQNLIKVPQRSLVMVNR
jgi:putative component of membrane protein insertase Oxa1/YidC/SpoIIIJ protein YidD